MKKLITILLVLIAVGAGGAAYYMRDTRPEPTVTTMPVTRGDIADVVPATGTLEAVTTVDVGTQVSGLVQDMYADFNSIVKKGQIIARLDPSLIQTQIEQRTASVIRAEADLERLRVSLADSERKLAQAQAMWDKQLIPRDQLDTADMNVKTLKSQIKSSEAGLTQAKADLNAQEVNLGHTVIKSPIDGIVISRSVDPGQTVAASMNAPVLYQIAEDLGQMQVLANIDEADVGRMRPGQHVTFRVDAYPTETFTGTVHQVRLQPTVVQNVVVYSTVIRVPNPQWKLKPGMTANVSIEVARKTDVLRVPAAATRFRPTEEMFQVLNQEMPAELQRGGGRGGPGGPSGRGGRGGDQGGQGQTPAAPPQGGASQPAGAPQQPASGAAQQPATSGGAPNAGPERQSQSGQRTAGEGGERMAGGRGGGRGGFDPNMTPEERRRRMEERLKNMTPEERQRWEQRMAQNGGGRDGNRDAARGDQGVGRRDMSRGIAGSVTAGGAVASGATTVDALFAPLPSVETRGRVWLFVDKKLKMVNVRLGISDGTYTELLSGDLTEDQPVVVNMVTGLEPRAVPGQSGSGNNPLMGQPQRGQPGRGGGGPGRGR
jgi:HlyD family secretion protein